jgi:DNA-binding transcriptional ArsR family regulator
MIAIPLQALINERAVLVVNKHFVHDRTMTEGPDFAEAANLMGEPARARMLTAMLDGRAWTATELALEAGVVPSTASAHLARMMTGGLISDVRQGRHRYFRLSAPDVATAIEALMALSARTTPSKRLPGPRDAALRNARSCYGHLAGTTGVALFEMIAKRGWIKNDGGGWRFDEAGRQAFGDWAGVEATKLTATGRGCLDWSERREHLGGALGRDLLALMVESRICSLGVGRNVTIGPDVVARMSALAVPNL